MYPRTTVFDDIANPLKAVKPDMGEMEQRVRNTAKLLKIDEPPDRIPSN
ncbi:MAG: hypothetical protein QW238_07065 [Candidatus Bathyarchaeia archaeon]